MNHLDSFIIKNAITLPREATIAMALSLIENSKQEAAVFLENMKIVGIITKSDFVNAFSKGFSHKDSAFEIATKNIVSFSLDRSLEYAVDILISKNLKLIPVVDKNGDFAGILTQDAIIDYFESKRDATIQKAANLVSGKRVIFVHADDNIKKCIELMNDYKIGFLPVFDCGKMVGSITDMDIIVAMKKPSMLEQSVSKLMSKSVDIVSESAGVEDILGLMRERNISHVVVSEGDEKLLGVLSKRDLTKNIKDSYWQILEKKLKSARDSLYHMQIPIIDAKRSEGGYYVVWHNAAALEMLGVELFDYKITDLITNRRFFDAIEAIDKDKIASKVDIDLLDKCYNVSISFFEDDVLQFVFHDITHIKKNSERLQKIIDILPEIVIVTNGKKIISCNESLLKFFGFSTFEEFVGNYSCICESFLEADGYLQYDAKGSWVETVLENTAKGCESLALMYDRDKARSSVFSVKAVELGSKEDDILVTFYDIAEMHIQRELLESQKKELEKLATTDSLTGIYNRNKLKEIATYEFKKLKREKYPLSMILFDIDHFKRINDTYGHNVGDLTLKSIAALVSSSIRESDTFVRWGGEEFIILAPNTSLQNACILAEKIRASIESYDFEAVGKVTCSFGVAEAGSRLKFDGLVEHADKALYAAKKGGRNRVEYF